MALKQALWKIKGMKRDIAESSFDSNYSYENKNIRIMATDNNTMFALVNEKGNTPISIVGIGDTLSGTPIGTANINNQLVVFTTENDGTESASTSNDRIYKISLAGEELSGNELYKGSLGFNYKYPIETITLFENESILKVYWTDGLNQPRVVNIAATKAERDKWNDDSFNFSRKQSFGETVTITRDLVANGSFSPGCILYCFSYFNKYEQETNIFYTSPLYYISYNNRGAAADDAVSNSFLIIITNPDTNYDYVRVYSIVRTSIDATTQCRQVIDLAIPTDGSSISYTDIGTSGSTIDPTELLYIGGEEVVFGTMALKDGTLFLGDIQLKRLLIDVTTRETVKGGTITFTNDKELTVTNGTTGYYPYDNQLKLGSKSIKTFKYLETYRFGLLAQHYTGKWSEPIWINDVQNTVLNGTPPLNANYSGYDYTKVLLTRAKYTLNDSTVIQNLIDEGYVKVRPVIVYPEIHDRTCVCQGILCPTVYNLEDRYSNSPFALASWFARPNAAFDIDKSSKDIGTTFDSKSYSLYSKGGALANYKVNYTDINFLLDPTNTGKWAEFRHNYPIPSSGMPNAEILCVNNPQLSVFLDDSTYGTDAKIAEWVALNLEDFYIDLSIFTMHSPDIEFDDLVRSLDTSGLKLRIIGYVPLTASVSDIDVQTSTSVNNFYDSSELPMGFYKESVGTSNMSVLGWKQLLALPMWFDELSSYKDDTGNTNHYSTAFVVYPWHRNGSLNNTKYAGTDGYKSAMLDQKKMSILRYSLYTQYLSSSNIWYAYLNNSTTNTGISGVDIFDSTELSLVRLKAPDNSGLDNINYYGNIDKVVAPPRITDTDKKNGYPIIYVGPLDASTNSHSLLSGTWLKPDGSCEYDSSIYVENPMSSFTEETHGLEPVRIRYKSTPHAVMALNYTTTGGLRVLPTSKDSSYTSQWTVNSVNHSYISMHSYWDKAKKTTTISQDALNVYSSYGYLWLGELYNDNVVNRFGGLTEEAFENNQWVPCGDAVDLLSSGSAVASVQLVWDEGDTYYQRYDNLKIYPYTFEDLNLITDIISFMCESRVNIDGRYDRNRGQTSNLAMSPTNFNKLNPVYSQQNNFFNYRTVNPNKLSLNDFRNSITWTKTKSAGELVDTWTNITLASTLDLDGDKGPVRALRKFKNDILAFLNTGVSLILYNDNMLISSSEGVPIEIANSGKVTGKRYLTNAMGCTNKWSICETPQGLYFIDNITKGLYAYNGLFSNLSLNKGFTSYFNTRIKYNNVWNPVDFDTFVTYYDKNNQDVLFINRTNCLAYSESLGEFSSFYSYEKTPYIVNLNDKLLAINKKYGEDTYRVWFNHEGDYNMYFGKYQPFYTTIIANTDPTKDKIFNQMEFRSDSWSGTTLLNTTFDTLTAWNEYLSSIIPLTMVKDKPSSLHKKFRVWRANIPRAIYGPYSHLYLSIDDTTVDDLTATEKLALLKEIDDIVYSRDRMRNPWLYLLLSMNSLNTNKTVLHDMVVNYFE